MFLCESLKDSPDSLIWFRLWVVWAGSYPKIPPKEKDGLSFGFKELDAYRKVASGLSSLWVIPVFLHSSSSIIMLLIYYWISF